jgi:protease IV
MASPFWSTTGRVFKSFWWFLDASRRAVLNLLLLALIGLVLWLLLRGGPAPLEPKTALVLGLQGELSEQFVGGTRDSAIRKLRGQDEPRVRLRDVLAVLDAAAKDPAITHMLLLPEELGAGGLPQLREVAGGIERFKAAGKPVIAWGGMFDQRPYFLAAHATEVWMHPMGGVLVEGYGRYRAYYKDLFDKAGVQAHVIRAGQYKSAGETFSANGPSQQTLESDAALYGTLWSSWTGAVEKARKLPAGSIVQAIDSLPASLAQVQGDAAKWALERKWIDGIKTRDQMREAMIARGAEIDRSPGDKTPKTFRQISFADYLARVEPQNKGADAVGVVVAEGPITDGEAPPGRIGGRSTAELIRQAREDDKVKAVVLRVNSPGGSAFGSELVRHELELTRKGGKPVVVSMGDLAASGGYWISTSSDEIIADEATVTGSIGVVAMLPTAEGVADKLGVKMGGTTTTWLGGAYDVRRGLDPRYATLVQSSVDRVYADFLARVATARKTTPDKIDPVAQGRVWAGKQALERGLIDRLGSLDDALKSAAKRAKLADGSYRVEYVERSRGRLDRLLEGLELRVATALGDGAIGSELKGLLLSQGALPAVLAPTARDLGWLADIAERHQPFAAVTHCLCVAP